MKDCKECPFSQTVGLCMAQDCEKHRDGSIISKMVDEIKQLEYEFYNIKTKGRHEVCKQ